MKSNSTFPKKVVVIGAGAGGLSCAIILAGLGCEVTVFEKNLQPGGLMRSYRRRGLECEVGVHYLGSLDRGQILRTFFDYLGISETVPVARMGKGGVIDRYHLHGAGLPPTVFDLGEGIDRYESDLVRTFPNEAGSVASLLTDIRTAAKQLHGLDFLYAEAGDFSLLDQFRPMGEIVHALDCSPLLRAILAIPSCWIGVPFADCPAFYHHMALASYLASSWRLVEGGAAMAEAMASRLHALGGEVITGEAVAKIEVDARVSRGVLLQSGRRVAADTVVAAVHPKVALAMLAPEDTKPSYRNRIASLVDTHGIFSAHVALDAARHPAVDHNIFKVEIDEHGTVPDMKYYQLQSTAEKNITLLSILTSGSEALWRPWQDTRTGTRGYDYQKAKEQHARKLIAEAKEVLGPLGKTELIDAYTPLTLRDWVNTPAGSAYGVQRSFSQTLAGSLLNRTAVKGLYLAGQSVLAPGILGTFMGSFATVKQMLGSEEFAKLIRF